MKVCHKVPIKSSNKHGVVLPSLILVTLVLVILSALLLATGTSSLRLVTHDLQSHQAYHAAEAGIVQATADFVQAGELASGGYQGTLPVTGAKYSVQAYENVTDEAKTVPGGLRIPPGTVYFLSKGTTVNKVERQSGALFRMGAGTFRAGVLAERVAAQSSNFKAYDSRTNVDPALSQLPGQGILTSNRTGTHTTPQFDLIDTVVEGGVYTSAGTSPDTQIQQSGTTTIETTSSLAEPITIEEIELPRVERGQSDDPADEAGEGEELEVGETHTIVSSPDLSVTWTGSDWIFKHGGYKTVTIPGSGGGQGSFSASQRVSVGGDGNVTFVHESQVVQTRLPGPVAPSIENPSELKSGGYNNVTISDGFETKLQDGGVYVVRSLEIIDSGQLKLDVDSPISIYVTESLVIEGANAILNTTQKPPNLKIYYTGTQDVNLAGGAQAYFTLVAPDANINLIGPAAVATDPTDPADPTAPVPDPTDPVPDPTDPVAEPDPVPTEPAPSPKTQFFGALVGKVVRVENADFFFDTATEGVGSGTDSTPFSLLSRHRL